MLNQTFCNFDLSDTPPVISLEGHAAGYAIVITDSAGDELKVVMSVKALEDLAGLLVTSKPLEPWFREGLRVSVEKSLEMVRLKR